MEGRWIVHSPKSVAGPTGAIFDQPPGPALSPHAAPMLQRVLARAASPVDRPAVCRKCAGHPSTAERPDRQPAQMSRRHRPAVVSPRRFFRNATVADVAAATVAFKYLSRNDQLCIDSECHGSVVRVASMDQSFFVAARAHYTADGEGRPPGWKGIELLRTLHTPHEFPLDHHRATPC